MAVNAEAVACVAEACRETDARLVYISTDYVFGGDVHRTIAYRETDAPAPQGVYARSKLAGEAQAARCPRHLVVRTCGLYGPTPKRNNFVEAILRAAAADRPLRVVNDQRCSPTNVADLARAIEFLVEMSAGGIFHVVNSGETTWYDFAVSILRWSGIERGVEAITSAALGALAPRPCYSVLNTAKYHALGGPIMPPIEDALERYLRARQESST
jgi:dTDP-4-dehydrorhamnose reductase